MLSGATCKAADTAGTAVFRIVVSSDSMKKATATSHGKTRLQTSEAQGLSPTVFGSVGGFIGWQIAFAAKARQVLAYLFGSAVYLMQFCGPVSVGENRALHALRPIPDGKSAFHAQCFSSRYGSPGKPLESRSRPSEIVSLGFPLGRVRRRLERGNRVMQPVEDLRRPDRLGEMVPIELGAQIPRQPRKRQLDASLCKVLL